MSNVNLKTQLLKDETILVCQKGTIMKGVRVSGHLTLTNKRLIWEKGDIANVLGMGLLSLAGIEYLSIPVTEIVQAIEYWIPAAAGIKFTMKSGDVIKFQLNGSKPKMSREAFIEYFNR